MPETFKAATWNVLYSTPAVKLGPVIERTRKLGVSIYLAQEASGDGVEEAFQAAGLETYLYAPQYLIAWDPDLWMVRCAWGTRLAPSPFFRHGGKQAAYADAALAILCDEAGRTLTAMSYHTPSHVQVPSPPPHRIEALREAAQSWAALAKGSETRACLFGGDDNVDETGPMGSWSFLARPATGLKLIQAPEPTHGNRRIDDFRVRGLRAHNGWTYATPGDHRLHAREFSWS